MLSPQGGHVIYDGILYDHDNYCLEKNDDESEWHLLVCQTSYHLHMKLHSLRKFWINNVLSLISLWIISAVAIISALLLGATVFVYTVFKELKTLAGRCFLFLSASLLVIQLLLTMLFFEIQEKKFERCFTIALSFCQEFSFLWMNVLTFDIWWTFKWEDSNQLD